MIVFDDLPDIPASSNIGIRPQAPLGKGLKDLPVSFEGSTSNFANAVAIDFKGASRRNL
jgi:hypothetical protein